jgi:hypothetical protein
MKNGAMGLSLYWVWQALTWVFYTLKGKKVSGEYCIAWSTPGIRKRAGGKTINSIWFSMQNA